MGFQVVKCLPSTSDYVAYCTLGLHRFPLQPAISGRPIRHELVLWAPATFGDQNIPAILQSVAVETIDQERAFLRGELIGPRGRVFEGLPFTAFYVTLPVYQTDDFQEFMDEAGHAIVFVWLVPIDDREAEYVRTHGWKKFEDLLEERDPHLTDFSRPSAI